MAKKNHYAQFCPVAVGAEIFAERWTPLVVRELLMGSRRFNDLRRGLPRMSQSLLSHRLKTLEDAGLVERIPAQSPRGGPEYRLTPGGEALRPVVEGLGDWAYRWIQRKLSATDLDATLLMWDMRRRIVTERLPRDPFVMAFHYPDAQREHRRIWMVWEEGAMDVCYYDPGKPVDLSITARLRTMTIVWLGDLSFADALRRGEVEVEGPPDYCRRLPDWLGLSNFAGVKRQFGPIS